MEARNLAKRTNCLVLVVVLMYIISQLIIRFFFDEDWINSNFYLILAFNQLFIILLPALAYVKMEKLEPLAVFRIKRISLPEALLIVLMAFTSSFIASALNSLMIYFLEKAGPVEMAGIPVPAGNSELWLQVFVIAFLPAVCEEFFFRGIIYNAYKGLGAGKSILISALYFSIFHFDISNLLGPFFLGSLIAWYCYRTGSIFAGTLAHFTNNFLAILINSLNRGTASDSGFLSADMLIQILMLAAFSGLFLLIISKVFEAITKNKTETNKEKEPGISSSIVFHWPMIIVYGIYLALAIRFIISLK